MVDTAVICILALPMCCWVGVDACIELPPADDGPVRNVVLSTSGFGFGVGVWLRLGPACLQAGLVAGVKGPGLQGVGVEVFLGGREGGEGGEGEDDGLGEMHGGLMSMDRGDWVFGLEL